MQEETERSWMWTVGVVWLAVLIAIMGMSLVMPFLALYLRDLGVSERDAPLWAGWIGGANFLCSAAVAPLWGVVSDRFGRKPMAIRALVGLAVSVGLMGYVHNVYELMGLRLLQGAFGGFVAAAFAMVGTSIPRERLGSALGFVQTAVVGGNLVGPLLGGELSHHFGYRDTFRITGGALLVAMLLILFLVREKHSPPGAGERKGVAENVRELMVLPELRWTLLAVLCSQCGMMLVNPQIALFVRALVHGKGDVNRLTGLVSAAPALTSFLMAPVWGRAGDRRGPAGILGMALVGAAIIVPWAGLAAAWWHILLVRLLMGAFTSALNPSTHSLVAHSVEENRTARAFSLLTSAQMLGSCVGPFLSGPLAASFGVRPLFPATALLLGCAAMSAFRVRALRSAAPLACAQPAAAE